MKKLRGFSLMEMMIVLLIVAILAAATAPMISKKLTRKTDGSSPWVWTSLTNNSIAYNIDGSDSAAAAVGMAGVPRGLKTRFFIDSVNVPQLSLSANGANMMHFYSNNKSLFITDDASVKNTTNSIAIGAGATSGTSSVAIGAGTVAPNYRVVAIGSGISANKADSVAIGEGSQPNAEAVIAIGRKAAANGISSIAMGYSAKGAGTNSVAIGRDANAKAANSISIGATTGAGANSIAMGAVSNAGANSIAIGSSATAIGASSIAVGTGRATGDFATLLGAGSASGSNSVSLGGGVAYGTNSIAISRKEGYSTYSAKAEGADSIAIGTQALAMNTNAIAIGHNAHTYGTNTVALGANAKTTASNQIVLGDANTTVVVPGTVQFQNLKVQGDLEVVGTTRLGTGGNDTYISMAQFNDNRRRNNLRLRHSDGTGRQNVRVSVPSDRRLKNVGKAFTGGLEQIDKLVVFNYTYKKDETKTPHVGVIAQDLQKVFPQAVFKGDDGFLRIRMEDMFFAMINAIKELDAKVNAIIDREKKIDDLQNQVNSLEKRLSALEKKVK